MANENVLRDRWNDAYHNSDEYQSALKSDAINRAAKASEARIALKQALAAGDTRHASRIQQQMADAQSEAALGRGGRTEGLDAYQNGRVTDYISQAQQRGQQELSRVAGGSQVAYGPGYLQEQQNPDFANQQPWIKVRNDCVKMPDDTAAADAFMKNATSTAHATTPADLAGAAGDSYRYHLAEIRREQNLVGSLPTELRSSYSKISGAGGMTPEEKTDFLSMPPEKQYAKLRSVSMAGASRSPNTGGEIQQGAVTHDYLGNGQERQFGSVGSSDFPSITRPVGNGRATAALAKPVAAPVSSGYNDWITPN